MYDQKQILDKKQEAVKASNSPGDGKDGILKAKKIFEWRQLFSNDDIYSCILVVVCIHSI